MKFNSELIPMKIRFKLDKLLSKNVKEKYISY